MQVMIKYPHQLMPTLHLFECNMLSFNACQQENYFEWKSCTRSCSMDLKERETNLIRLANWTWRVTSVIPGGQQVYVHFGLIFRIVQYFQVFMKYSLFDFNLFINDIFDSRVFRRKMRESLLSVRWLLWRTQHALPASCSSRLLLLLCSLVSTIYSIWMKLPSSDNVAQWVGHQCKMAERVEVCASSTERVHF